MAYCITPQWVSAAPQVKLTVTQKSSTDTAVVLSWALEYIASYAADAAARAYTVKLGGETVKNGTFNIDGKTGTHLIAEGTKTINKTTSAQSVSFSVSFAFDLTWSGAYKGTLSAASSIFVAAKTSYRVSYNANGGSGVPSAQTKWHGTALTLSSTKPTRTGYTFQGWATSSSGSVAYLAGANYSANATVILYAVWKANTYIVRYNANGGVSAPVSQNKTHGVALTITNSKPTRTNYTFKGWGTSASSTTVTYAPGSSYTANAGITLYAIWALAYTKPRIFNVSANRCDSEGTPTDDGSQALVSFSYQTDGAVTSCNILYKEHSAASWDVFVVGTTRTSDTISRNIPAVFDVEKSYDIRVEITDSETSYATATLPSMVLPIDCKAGGRGVAFGKSAEIENTAEFEFDAKFNNSVYGNVLGLNKLPEIPANSDLNTYIETGSFAVYKTSNAETIANMPVKVAGRLEVSAATGEGIRPQDWSYLRQRFIPYNSTNAVWERTIARNSDNVWSFGGWWQSSLTPVAAQRVYHEQKVLWEGASYMSVINGTAQTITLAEKVSEQPNGIVLCFSKFANGAAQEHNFNNFFIPKAFVESKYGCGTGFTMMDIDFGQICHKYLYINDSTITGHANNTASGTGASGITYANSNYVLRYVYGV